MTDFVKALHDAQKLPAGSETVPFDPFGSRKTDDVPVARISDDPEALPGAVEWDLTYHAERFYTGRELTGIAADGTKEFGDRDETGRYQEVMSRILSGKATSTNRIQTVLSDGSVVIWLEWTERKTPSKTPRGVDLRLTSAELTSPARLTPHSTKQDAIVAAAKEVQAEMSQGGFFSDGVPKDPVAEEDVPSTNEEPDW